MKLKNKSSNKRLSENSVRRRRRQLFSNPNNQLVRDNDVDVDESLASMAGDIHSLLAKTMNQDESQDNLVTLTDDVSGIKIDNFGTNDNACALEGKVRFTAHKIQGLDSFFADNLELVAGSEDYEAITDYRGRLQGYKWNGVWKVTATLNPIRVDVTSQVDVDACGSALDYTTFGGIAVNSTTITAAIRINGELSKDLSGHLVIEDAEVLEQHVHFNTPLQTGSLDCRLPVDFGNELQSLVQFLFAKKLERPVLPDLSEMV